MIAAYRSNVCAECPPRWLRMLRVNHGRYIHRDCCSGSATLSRTSPRSQNQTINRNEVLTLPFTVADAETPLNLLGLSASSSNPNLIPNVNLLFSGSGDTTIPANNAGQQLPRQCGISVTVHDGLRSAVASFLLTVDGTNFAPALSRSSIRRTTQFTIRPQTSPSWPAHPTPTAIWRAVDYYWENGLFATAFTPPYAVTLNNVPAGTYDWRCVATDVGGLSVTSALRRVVVRQGPLTLIASGAIGVSAIPTGWISGTAWRCLELRRFDVALRPSKLGFGDPATTMVDSTPTRITTYFRTRFTLANPAVVTNLTLGVLRDDGAVVYLNGTEVFRTGMPREPFSTVRWPRPRLAAPRKPRGSPTHREPVAARGRNKCRGRGSAPGSTSSSDLGFNLLLLAGVTPSSSPVTLVNQRSGNNLIFRGPLVYGWNLYATPVLKDDAQWVRVMAGITTINGQSFYTAPTTQPAQFFRLRQP
jgi:hypothetical protein